MRGLATQTLMGRLQAAAAAGAAVPDSGSAPLQSFLRCLCNSLSANPPPLSPSVALPLPSFLTPSSHPRLASPASSQHAFLQPTQSPLSSLTTISNLTNCQQTRGIQTTASTHNSNGNSKSPSQSSQDSEPPSSTPPSNPTASDTATPNQTPSGSASSSTASGSTTAKEIRMSLQEALTTLVDEAVHLVEQNNLEGAIGVLKEGITTFEPNFPGSPELGELYNQVALLSLVAGDVEGAAHHAQIAHEMTRAHFGQGSVLLGHRSLRLGVARFAQGKISEATGLLHSAHEALRAKSDPSRHEAMFYLDLVMLTGASDVNEVLRGEEQLLQSIKNMKDTFGADSMIVSLATSQHDRVVHQPLASPDPNAQLCEALLKQHIRVLETVNKESEELAVTHYKLATFYYVQDMLTDAASAVRIASQALRAVYPEDHDLVVLCKHRMGMICAASGDHRAAAQLLEASLAQYSGGTAAGEAGSTASDGLSGLAREARVGLAMARYRALPLSVSAADRQAAIKVMRDRLDELAAAIGTGHMLVRGAMRHFATLSVMDRTSQ